jgi:hypothetical protein
MSALTSLNSITIIYQILVYSYETITQWAKKSKNRLNGEK